MARRISIFLSGLALAMTALTAAHGAQKPVSSDFDQKAALDASRAAVGRQLGDYVFRDTDGKRVALSSFRGRPVIVNLIYTACRDFCPTAVQALAVAVDGAEDALGADSFTILTIGFDTSHDNPAQMRAYAKSQGVDFPNWHFLASDPETILALTEQVGFAFYKAPQGFDHLAQTTILDGDGRVFRQVYGADITVSSIVEPMKQIRFGETANLTSLSNIFERIKLFCTLYDPNEDAYRFDWSFFTGMAVGLLSISALAVFFIHTVLQYRKFGR